MVCREFCCQETFRVFIYGEIVYMLSYTDVLYPNIFPLFMTFICIFKFFVDPTHMN